MTNKLLKADLNKRRRIRRSVEISLTALNAALYAGFGYLTYLGLFTPVFGTVRFWPAVVIPAAFSILFSPRIGGVGAAIGIFISDMLVHGNPILSLSVGVPSNFTAFYLIGYLANRWKTVTAVHILSSIFIQFIPVMGSLAIYFGAILDETVALVFLMVSILVFAFTLILSVVQRKFLIILHASTIGLLIGSGIIGLGLWAYSQFAILPIGGTQNAPLIAAAIWFLWTYLTEIPFLYFILPPLVHAINRAMPAELRIHRKEVEKS